MNVKADRAGHDQPCRARDEPFGWRRGATTAMARAFPFRKAK
jgi:hypothetical protein